MWWTVSRGPTRAIAPTKPCGSLTSESTGGSDPRRPPGRPIPRLVLARTVNPSSGMDRPPPRALTLALADIEAAKNTAVQQIADQSTKLAFALARKLIHKELRPEDHTALIRESLEQFPSEN